MKGLWYQASWGDGLQNMTQGEKVQATSENLYLGVIKQTGASGFYRLLVSEKKLRRPLRVNFGQPT